MRRRAMMAMSVAGLVGSAAAAKAKENSESVVGKGLLHINPEGMHKSPVFSQGIVVPAGMRTLLIGGQNGVDASGRVVSDTLSGQTARAVENLLRVLEAAGGRLEDLVRVGLFIKGEADITPGFDEWMKRAGRLTRPPTVSAVRVLGLANPEFLIEIEAMAVLQ